MNTDMNQYLIFRKYMGMLVNYCKKNDSLSAESLVLGKLACHLCLQSTFLVVIIDNWHVELVIYCSSILNESLGDPYPYNESWREHC